MNAAWRDRVKHYRTAETAAAYRRKYRRSWSRRLSDRRERALLRRLLVALGPVESVLDAPCGAGRMLPLCARAARRVCAADLSLSMVREARAVAGVEWFLIADVGSLPFPDGAFDAVICHRLLHHVPEPGARIGILRESGRVARRAVIATFADAGTLRARRTRASRRIRLSAAEFAAEAHEAGLALARPPQRLGGWFSTVAVALLRSRVR